MQCLNQPHYSGAGNNNTLLYFLHFAVESEREETHHLLLENSESIQVKYLYIYSTS